MMRKFTSTAGGIAIAVLMIAVACGSESDGGAGDSAQAHRVEVDLGMSEPLVAFGNVLLASASGADGDGAGAFRSADLGESWEPLELPGRPDGEGDVQFEQVMVEGELAILTGFAPEGGHHYIWATSDGTDWHGGQFPSEMENRSSSDLQVAALEGRMMAVVEGEGPSRSDQVEVRSSDDLGATWTLCADNESDAEACMAAVYSAGEREVAGSLVVSDGEVSLDGGRTWQSPVIEPDLGPDAGSPGLHGPVEVSGGGWLAVGRVYEIGDQSRGLVLRSDDGVHWQQLLDPDPCREEDATEGRPNSSVSAPVPLGDRWLVWYSCGGLTDRFWSRLYVLEADGAGLTELSGGLDTEGDYGRPVVVGDAVVVPELEGEDDQVVALVHLR